MKPLIEIIDKIKDESIQREYLLKLKEIIDQKENQDKIKPYNLQEIENSNNKVTIQDLQVEINISKKKSKK